MTVTKFNVLLNLVGNKIEKFSRRESIDKEARLAITLMYLSHGCCPQVLAWSYKMGASTVREIIYETCDAIWSELHEIYVAPPNAAEWATITEKFYVKTGMPHCLGAVDGKHVDIVCPARSGSLYFNYKRKFSIVLMAACDSDYIFRFVDVGAMGSQSDGGVFAKSVFGRVIARGNLQLPPDAALPGTNTMFTHFFVGDNAFPLKRNLMRPYPGRHLPTIKRNFNEKLSSARVHIWRILYTSIYAAPKNVDKVILATIALHNFLMADRSSGYFNEELVDHIENYVFVPGTWRDSSEPLRSIRISQANRSAVEVFQSRDELANYLFNNL